MTIERRTIEQQRVFGLAQAAKFGKAVEELIPEYVSVVELLSEQEKQRYGERDYRVELGIYYTKMFFGAMSNFSADAHVWVVSDRTITDYERAFKPKEESVIEQSSIIDKEYYWDTTESAKHVKGTPLYNALDPFMSAFQSNQAVQEVVDILGSDIMIMGMGATLGEEKIEDVFISTMHSKYSQVFARRK